MTWKCMVCETNNRDRLLVCEVCDAVRADIDPSDAITRSEIACVKVESQSSFGSIEEYIYETRSPARLFEKKLLKAGFYAKCSAFILIPWLVFYLVKFLLNIQN